MNLCSKSALLVLLLLCLCGCNSQPASREYGLPDASDPVSCMGVNIHFVDAKPGELEMLSRAGFRWIRTDLFWGGTEKKPGVYDFSGCERLLASLDKFHIRALLVLGYSNSLYNGGLSPHSDEDRAAFARWAVAMATHFKNRGVIWEIWNEPNNENFWHPITDVATDYPKLALAASKAIHEAAPDERVVGPALAAAEPKFLESVAKSGVLQYWAGVTVHPYFHAKPENYALAYARTQAPIDRYVTSGHHISLLCGESGYTTTWPGMDDVTQGKYLARLFLYDVMAGVPLTIWYDWRDDGTDANDPEHHFGIVGHDYHAGAEDVYKPKPAYEAAETYSEELAGYRFKERLKTASAEDYVLSFTKGGGTCFVAWTTTATPHEALFRAPEGSYAWTSYDGMKGASIAPVNGMMALMLTDGPQYLLQK